MKTTTTKTVYAVQDTKTGEFYNETQSAECTLENAKTWKTVRAAFRIAREWGSKRKPASKNQVVEIAVRTTTSLSVRGVI